MNCSVIYVELLIYFSYIYEVLKRFVCHNFKVEIRDVYILLYSLTIAQWLKITELGYRCATTVSFKVA